MAAEAAPPRLRIGVLGTGRAGSVLAAALRRAGHPVTAAYAVSDLSRVRCEALLPGTPIVDQAGVFASSDLVLLTVPDDALPQVVAGLVEHVRAGQIVVHASGRYGTAVVDPMTRAGALPLALHPVMTFTGTSVDLTRLQECPFGVTAPDPLLPMAEALVVEMGGEPVVIPEESRPIYHAAIVHAANHLMALVSQATEVLDRAGIPAPERLIEPLLRASLDNALHHGDRVLTGPVARGDARTVAAHLDALAAVAPGARATYIALARVTADRALTAGVLSPEAAAGLLVVLGEESP